MCDNDDDGNGFDDDPDYDPDDGGHWEEYTEDDANDETITPPETEIDPDDPGRN